MSVGCQFDIGTNRRRFCFVFLVVVSNSLAVLRYCWASNADRCDRCSRSVMCLSVNLSRDCAKQKRTNGSRSRLGWSLLQTHRIHRSDDSPTARWVRCGLRQITSASWTGDSNNSHKVNYLTDVISSRYKKL